ncbi:MAG: hypothetical protein KME56_15570 [Candidatus Thiodiazotropha sp. (ex Ctena orbiculata)]|uniref:Uncharacterized protein n=1 Tax=Candidatus Thiodiazotropha taylori TaxID=2792791 RepID=A0A944QUQ5_9GAMM|nr:hypothetical protein [Candidatus Thiodiazotropha taylori]MBT2990377.1 hypothetical protein [Candidatus Thiodiazotropha taylori]MBT2998031.1 hypothetical protein [Candidatus Thiodiazotropha taylori]MBT3002242.1 hypothetical protein [Candidatus Thiodiazotropha taylori]MBT3029106.1 hypothetical protein [Candidatus Thiodiazotropha taylori]
MNLQTAIETPHPAALWAQTAPLDPLQIDCVTAVMLKILDNKCKMLPEEQMAMMAIYSVVKEKKGQLFESTIHTRIDEALRIGGSLSIERIHELRLYAEATIPKPVMKHFKSYLRESLYGI